MTRRTVFRRATQDCPSMYDLVGRVRDALSDLERCVDGSGTPELELSIVEDDDFGERREDCVRLTMLESGGWILMDPDTAESLADELKSMAREARENNERDT